MRDTVRRCLLEAAAEVSGGAGEARARFRFPADLPLFAGHFPGRPLVPGVLLLEAARHTAERALDRDLALSGVLDARFTGEVRPDDVVQVVATLAPDSSAGHDAWSCRVSVRSPRGEAARLRLRLTAEERG